MQSHGTEHLERDRAPQEHGSVLLLITSHKSARDALVKLAPNGPKASIWLWGRFSSPERIISQIKQRIGEQSTELPFAVWDTGQSGCAFHEDNVFLERDRAKVSKVYVIFFFPRERLIFTSSKKQPVYTFAGGFAWKKIKIGELDLTHLEQMGMFCLASCRCLNWG